jgi:hypothetical protein
MPLAFCLCSAFSREFVTGSLLAGGARLRWPFVGICAQVVALTATSLGPLPRRAMRVEPIVALRVLLAIDGQPSPREMSHRPVRFANLTHARVAE